VNEVLFAQSPGALIRRVKGDVLLASQHHEGVDLLSGTARSVWELLASPRTLESLLQELAESYAVDRRVISTDVESLLDDLEARGWVERVVDHDD
jgi:DNA-binding MarR family transcriptional regulator